MLRTVLASAGRDKVRALQTGGAELKDHLYKSVEPAGKGRGIKCVKQVLEEKKP